MKSHSEHAKKGVEPLVVARVVHCGQSRLVHGDVDDLTRVYRIEPHVAGTLRVTYHRRSQKWSATEDLGRDYGGWPLLSLADLTKLVIASNGWINMEKALATYFSAPVFEFHADSPGLYRTKADPTVGDGAGE